MVADKRNQKGYCIMVYLISYDSEASPPDVWRPGNPNGKAALLRAGKMQMQCKRDLLACYLGIAWPM